MEVVCLILDPTKPCSNAFWVLKSLHLLSFLLEMFFIILVSLFFFLIVNIFCRFYLNSFNHKCIKVCSSMKVNFLYISIIYELIIILFRLQMMSILYLTTKLSAALQEVVSVTVSTIPMFIIVYNMIIQWLYVY